METTIEELEQRLIRKVDRWVNGTTGISVTELGRITKYNRIVASHRGTDPEAQLRHYIKEMSL